MKKEFTYLPAGLDRLMVEVLARAVRDAYSTETPIRSNAREWLRQYGAEFIQIYEIGIPVAPFERWIRNGFVLPNHKVRMLRKHDTADRRDYGC